MSNSVDRPTNVMRVNLLVSLDMDGNVYTPAGIAKRVMQDLSCHYRVQSVEDKDGEFKIVKGGYGTMVNAVPLGDKHSPSNNTANNNGQRVDLITPELLRECGFRDIGNNTFSRCICWNFTVRQKENVWELAITNRAGQEVHRSIIVTLTQIMQHVFDFQYSIYDEGFRSGHSSLQMSLRRLLGMKLLGSDEDDDEVLGSDEDDDDDEYD